MDPKKNKPVEYHEHDTPHNFPETSDVASATELTGLMHRSPVDDAEREAYEELYSMEIPKDPE